MVVKGTPNALTSGFILSLCSMLSSCVSLRGRYKHNQDSNLDHTYCQPASDGHAAGAYMFMEFSGLATMVRINLMYYVDFYSLFNHPEKDWENMLKTAAGEPHQPSLFD